jgi:hypothetical protein
LVLTILSIEQFSSIIERKERIDVENLVYASYIGLERNRKITELLDE